MFDLDITSTWMNEYPQNISFKRNRYSTSNWKKEKEKEKRKRKR